MEATWGSGGCGPSPISAQSTPSYTRFQSPDQLRDCSPPHAPPVQRLEEKRGVGIYPSYKNNSPHLILYLESRHHLNYLSQPSSRKANTRRPGPLTREIHVPFSPLKTQEQQTDPEQTRRRKRLGKLFDFFFLSQPHGSQRELTCEW